jgi:tetratricopeptide (TPR) repeat protein
LRREQFNQAEAEFRRSIAMKPLQERAYFALAQELTRRNDLPGALATFDAMLSRQPRNLGAVFGKAVCLFRLKEPEQAYAWAVKTLEIDPQFAPARQLAQMTKPSTFRMQ